MIRPYIRETDAEGLYQCKLAFERELGKNTGGETKATAYENKLTDEYRERWLDWVTRCVDSDERCVTVAVDSEGSAATTGDLVGYVFVLPEQLAMIWDAAVINELYVDPAYRGTGIGDDLMAAAVDLASDQTLPLDRVILDVDPANERARAFYHRHGFDGWGEIVARPIDR